MTTTQATESLATRLESLGLDPNGALSLAHQARGRIRLGVGGSVTALTDKGTPLATRSGEDALDALARDLAEQHSGPGANDRAAAIRADVARKYARPDRDLLAGL